MSRKVASTATCGGAGQAKSLAERFRKQPATAEDEAAVRTDLEQHPDDLQRITAFAELAYKAGHWDDAASRYQAVLKARGANASPRDYRRLAEACRRVGASSDAEAAIRVGLNHYPGDLALLTMFAESAFNANHWDDAVSRFRAVMDAGGEKVPARVYLQLAHAHQKRFENDEADAVIRLGLDRYPGDLTVMTAFAEAAWKAERWKDAATRCRAVLETHGNETPAKIYSRLARAYQICGAHDDALATIKSGLARFPASLNFMTMFAKVAFNAQDWCEAVSRYRAILNTHAEAPASVYHRLALALRAVGQADDADAVMNRGLARYPDNLRLLSLYPWWQTPRQHLTKVAKAHRRQGSAEATFAREVECLKRLADYPELSSPRRHFPRLVSWDSRTMTITTEFIGVSLQCLAETAFHQSVTELDTQVSNIMRIFEAAGIIHLDIIPENIVVDTNGTVGIVDFGMSVLDGVPTHDRLAHFLDEFTRSGGYAHQGERIREFVLSTCRVR